MKAVAADSTSLQQEPTIVKDIVYNAEAGEIGTGDLFLPAKTQGAKAILLIHGGAWKSMDRHRMEGVADFMARLGYAVFNIDYRLLPQAPYPACEQDCILAAQFLLQASHPSMKELNLDKITVIGASAGGHLALMTGLKLPREKVASIIDISGPTDLTTPEIKGLLKFSDFTRSYTDKTEELLANASPTKLVTKNPPPLLVIHCINDGIVDIIQADRIIKSWRENEGEIQAYLYDGDRKRGHNIWKKEEKSPRLHLKLEKQISTFLSIYHPLETPAR